MRQWIDLVTESYDGLPAMLYHGTSDKQWASDETGILYVTKSRDDANYADEAVVGDFNALNVDYEEGMEMPSNAIVVEFITHDLLALEDRFLPDWGWEHATTGTSWRESFDAVGSFCISSFSEKHIGRPKPAF